MQRNQPAVAPISLRGIAAARMNGDVKATARAQQVCPLYARESGRGGSPARPTESTESLHPVAVLVHDFFSKTELGATRVCSANRLRPRPPMARLAAPGALTERAIERACPLSPTAVLLGVKPGC